MSPKSSSFRLLLVKSSRVNNDGCWSRLRLDMTDKETFEYFLVGSEKEIE